MGFTSADKDKTPDGYEPSGRMKKNPAPKKISAKRKKEIEQPPDPAQMLQDTQRIINAEISRLRAAITTRELFPFETKQLELYVRMILQMDRKSANADFTDLSNEELLELAKKAIDDERKK